jgi:DNA gyrase/topoisomerase IV subunit A
MEHNTDKLEDEIEKVIDEIQHTKEELNHEEQELKDIAKELKEQEQEEHLEVTIFVNIKPHEWKEKQISYEKLVDIAYPDHNTKPNTYGYRVNYSNGPEKNPFGEMTKGSKVFVKNKMNFNVHESYQS